MELRYLPAVTLLILAVCQTNYAQGSDGLVMDRFNPLGQIQPDTSSVRLPEVVAGTDTAGRQSSCNRLTMPVIPYSKHIDHLPLMPIPDSLHFSMPVITPETNCGNRDSGQ